MQNKIKIGIVGYGNVGRGAECAVLNAPDMELVAIISRRPSLETLSQVPVVSAEDFLNWRDKIDVLLMCGGSATDLMEQTPYFTQYFNTVDSFDTHARISEHFATVDKIAKENGKLSIISTGWDPGLFSLNRLIAESILPTGKGYTFWGPGVSQGHSDALRRIDGVLDAKQYTIPVEKAIQAIRNGESPDLSTREKHTRDCYIVAEAGADRALIEKTIKEMPYYFADYDTTVTFINMEEFEDKHINMPHGGFVFRSGTTVGDNRQVIEFALKLDSNPEFTSNTMVAYARAVHRLHQEGESGAKTVFDIAPKYLSIKTIEELRAELL